MWPCLSSDGRAVIIIELRSPDGELLVQAPAQEITAFVNQTIALVPEGAGELPFDIDELIGQTARRLNAAHHHVDPGPAQDRGRLRSGSGPSRVRVLAAPCAPTPRRPPR